LYFAAFYTKSNTMNTFAFTAAFLACVAMTGAIFPLGALTITSGGTAFVLSASQVSVAAASIAALAITKELLIKSAISRGRGRRDINSISQTPVHLEPFFDTIAQSDLADCGKLLVCHAMAKTDNTLTSEEKAITKLFDNLEVINPNTGYAEYQLAAFAGSFKQPELCAARYSRCPVSTSKLGELIKLVDF
jgi:hypothetical protein